MKWNLLIQKVYLPLFFYQKVEISVTLSQVTDLRWNTKPVFGYGKQADFSRAFDGGRTNFHLVMFMGCSDSRL